MNLNSYKFHEGRKYPGTASKDWKIIIIIDLVVEEKTQKGIFTLYVSRYELSRNTYVFIISQTPVELVVVVFQWIHFGTKEAVAFPWSLLWLLSMEPLQGHIGLDCFPPADQASWHQTRLFRDGRTLQRGHFPGSPAYLLTSYLNTYS